MERHSMGVRRSCTDNSEEGGMSRLLLLFCAGGFLATVTPTPSTAQDRIYEENALRIDESRGTITIVRGVSETVVAKIGVFRAVDVAVSYTHLRAHETRHD